MIRIRNYSGSSFTGEGVLAFLSYSLGERKGRSFIPK